MVLATRRISGAAKCPSNVLNKLFSSQPGAARCGTPDQEVANNWKHAADIAENKITSPIARVLRS